MENFNLDDYITDYNPPNISLNEIYDNLCRIGEENETFEKISAQDEIGANFLENEKHTTPTVDKLIYIQRYTSFCRLKWKWEGIEYL